MELTVSQLNETIKLVLETATFLQEISIIGEVSNLTKHSSGHFYFNLKDENAQLTCVMFRTQAQMLPISLTNGMKVKALGNIKVYAARGNYQLQVESIIFDGLGELYVQFLALKEKLQAEGLFDQSKKNALPQFPKVIGVVTSPTGAVINDIITTVNKRFPALKIILSPSLVQGIDAPSKLIEAFKKLQKIDEIDLIIVARGGGSIEDLWAFNDEALSRLIFTSKVPVISAIGHETDFTILDFVADKRAATPTAAAEMATPDSEAILEWLNDMHAGTKTFIQQKINNCEQEIDDFEFDAKSFIHQWIENRKNLIDLIEAKLMVFDVSLLLNKGYSITMVGDVVVKNANEVEIGAEIKTILSTGEMFSIKK